MTISDPTPPVPDRSIAVVGATGLQGGLTARTLLGKEAKVRALVRDPAAAAAASLAEQGAELVRASLDDPESLRAAFEGSAAVFAMTTPGSDQDATREAEHGKAIADAAAAVGVPHLVYSSVGGAERGTGIPHFDSKRVVEEYMLELGLSVIFVRPVFFMDNFARFMAPTSQDGALVVRMPLPAGIPLQMIAAEDVGIAAAAALLHPELVAGGAVEIAGDELTGEQIAEAYGVRYGQPDRYEPIPVEALADNVDQHAMFSWFARLPAYQADFAATRTLAPKAQTFADWLEKQGPL